MKLSVRVLYPRQASVSKCENGLNVSGVAAASCNAAPMLCKMWTRMPGTSRIHAVRAYGEKEMGGNIFFSESAWQVCSAMAHDAHPSCEPGSRDVWSSGRRPVNGIRATPCPCPAGRIGSRSMEAS
ncbi:hypothetical protein ASZ90_001279 [hydrocarbon metagenome]|uniref:Uncharacterized protein n=1 Tax=hydrocarbon metagenome TaxID=938273 RepID=A0A0W8G6X3_9ZZZZ